MNPPVWLKPGALVKVQHWYGVVEDVAVSQSRVMVLVKSPKGVVAASFTYDADGKRVKSVMGADTILFVGAHYEVKNGSEITQYYMAGSTRIAMRKYTIPQNMSVEYLLSDHLGSTSLTTDVNGAKVLELRYKAWGEVRATWTANPTTTPAYRSPAYTYTGQYSYMDDPATSGTAEGFGLMFYNARWYDPTIGRFAQADTMIPGGAQGPDRYAYSNNSPIVYTDPSGHMPCNGENCSEGGYGSSDGDRSWWKASQTETPQPLMTINGTTVYSACGSNFISEAPAPGSGTTRCTEVHGFSLNSTQAWKLNNFIYDTALDAVTGYSVDEYIT